MQVVNKAIKTIRDVSGQITNKVSKSTLIGSFVVRLVKILGGTSILFVVTQILRKAWYVGYHRYKKYPPGPIGIPLFGCFFNKFDYWNFYTMIGKKYPAVTMFPLGVSYSAVINDINLVFKYSSKDEFAVRPSVWLQSITNQSYPPAFTVLNGDQMKKRRKLFHNFIMKTTESNSMIKHLQKSIVKVVIPSIENAITENNGSWAPRDTLFDYTFNTLFSASFGSEWTISHNDENYQEFKAMVSQRFSILGFLFMLTPAAPFFLRMMGKSRRFKNFHQRMHEIFNQWFEQRRNLYTNSEFNPYIGMMSFSDIESRTALSDIVETFQVGPHTSASSIEFMLFMAAKHPDVQEIIHLQLKKIFHKADDIQIKSALQLNEAHYLKAFVDETFRLSIGPGNPRELLCDVKIEFKDKNGRDDHFVLPKGCFVEFNGPYLVRNEKSGWKNPLQWDVGNYLDTNGKFIKNTLNKDLKLKLNIFGYGKRNCPGWTYGYKETIFTIAILFYKYKFCGPRGEGDINFEAPFFLGATADCHLTVIKR
eukprot:436646_1